MKKLGLLCTAALLTLSLAACSGNGGKQGGTDNNGGTANNGDKQLKVAIVLSTGDWAIRNSTICRMKACLRPKKILELISNMLNRNQPVILKQVTASLRMPVSMI